MKKRSKIAVVIAMVMAMALSLVACGTPKNWDELQTQYKTLVDLHNEVTSLYDKKNLAETNPDLGKSINDSAAVINKVGETKSNEINDDDCDKLIKDVKDAIEFYKQTKTTIEKIDTTQKEETTDDTAVEDDAASQTEAE